MTITTITGKLGNMRKSVEWTVYPARRPSERVRLIQCDKRIAAVNLDTGEAVVSDGKGHPGFQKLSDHMGATKCMCPSDMLEQLRGVPEVGPVRLV